jgi:hypothetical protein
LGDGRMRVHSGVDGPKARRLLRRDAPCEPTHAPWGTNGSPRPPAPLSWPRRPSPLELTGSEAVALMARVLTRLCPRASPWNVPPLNPLTPPDTPEPPAL